MVYPTLFWASRALKTIASSLVIIPQRTVPHRNSSILSKTSYKTFCNSIAFEFQPFLQFLTEMEMHRAEVMGDHEMSIDNSRWLGIHCGYNVLHPAFWVVGTQYCLPSCMACAEKIPSVNVFPSHTWKAFWRVRIIVPRIQYSLII